MKTDFLLAVTQLAAERNLPKDVVFAAVEAALVSAYKKDDFGAHHNISVKIHPASGEVKVYALKTAVEDPRDTNREISLDEAQKVKKDAQLGEIIAQEVTALHGGRIAAQTAKQVVLQRLREAEREFVFGEYANREGEVVSGVVERVDARHVVIDLGKAEGILPNAEQVRAERYRAGQRIKLYLLEVNRSNRGPRLILSRSHPNLIRRLFELEVPEIRDGTVTFEGIAREPGYRSKVAVAARQEGVDPVGSCVGLRGVRIQNVVNELNGERIDVIQWHSQPKVFIANALSPAQVISVATKDEEKTALVVVPDGQLSLAIGKEGQNARLAAKLTGWKIDIKSASAVAAEREALAVAEPAEAVSVAEPSEAVLPEELAEVMLQPQIADIEQPSEVGEVLPPEAPKLVVGEAKTMFPEAEAVVEVLPEKPELRFAEDIFAPRAPKPQSRSRDKKKRKHVGGEGIEEDKVKKRRKLRLSPLDEEFEDQVEE